MTKCRDVVRSVYCDSFLGVFHSDACSDDDDVVSFGTRYSG